MICCIIWMLLFDVSLGIWHHWRKTHTLLCSVRNRSCPNSMQKSILQPVFFSLQHTSLMHSWCRDYVKIREQNASEYWGRNFLHNSISTGLTEGCGELILCKTYTTFIHSIWKNTKQQPHLLHSAFSIRLKISLSIGFAQRCWRMLNFKHVSEMTPR